MGEKPFQALRSWGRASIVVGMVCGLFAFVPQLAQAQGGPTLTVETAQIPSANGTVVLDVTLDAAGEVIVALTFELSFDSQRLRAISYEQVLPAGGAFNASRAGEIVHGAFYTVDPFDPNDAGGFSGETVIGRLTLSGIDLGADAAVAIDVIDAFQISEQAIEVVAVSGAVTIGAEPAATPTPGGPTPTITPTATATPTPGPTTTPTTTAVVVISPPAGPSVGGIAGYVWADINQDGLQDVGEGVAGVLVTASGPSGSFTATTDSSGQYQIGPLSPDDYTVVFETPPNGFWTLQDVGSDDAIDSDADALGNAGTYQVRADAATRVDAGLIFESGGPSSIGGYVWQDINADGLQEFGEGIEGVQVTIVGPSGTRFATTDASGEWSIFGVMPGSYQVTFTSPAGRAWTAQDVGNDDSIDSDVNVQGDAGTYTLIPGQGTRVDAGILGSASPATATPTVTSTVEVLAPTATVTPTITPTGEVQVPTATVSPTMMATVEPVGPTPTATPTVASQAPTPTATPTADAGTSQIDYAGPFKVVPADPQSTIGGFGLNPQAGTNEVLGTVQTSSPPATASTAVDTSRVPLANTGAQTNLLTTLSIVLLVAGGALLVAARRQT